jgi:hypothetical protein
MQALIFVTVSDGLKLPLQAIRVSDLRVLILPSQVSIHPVEPNRYRKVPE